MTAASAVGERLARLLLLALTVLGVAALHTIGHAAGADQEHSRVPAAAGLSSVALSSVALSSASIPDDRDGCAGDGCAHQAAMPIDNGQGSRWWEACLAVLSILAVGIFAAGPQWHVRTGSAAGAGARRPPPRAGRTPPLGLALAAGAVLRT